MSLFSPPKTTSHIYCDYVPDPAGIRCRHCHRIVGGELTQLTVCPKSSSHALNDPLGLGTTVELMAHSLGYRRHCHRCVIAKVRLNALRSPLLVYHPRVITWIVPDIRGRAYPLPRPCPHNPHPKHKLRHTLVIFSFVSLAVCVTYIRRIQATIRRWS